jgi:hypothetical protein
MISAVTQTLASLLADETSLTGTEQIDFDHPATRRCDRPRLNLFCYDLRQCNGTSPDGAGHSRPSFQHRVYRASQVAKCQASLTAKAGSLPDTAFLPNKEPFWFDISFILSAWDWTELGEQRLLSEALSLLLHHRLLREDRLVPALWGWGGVSLQVSTVPLGDIAVLWQALGAPLRPALYITVRAPFPQFAPAPARSEMLLTSLR